MAKITNKPVPTAANKVAAAMQQIRLARGLAENQRRVWDSKFAEHVNALTDFASECNNAAGCDDALLKVSKNASTAEIAVEWGKPSAIPGGGTAFAPLLKIAAVPNGEVAITHVRPDGTAAQGETSVEWSEVEVKRLPCTLTKEDLFEVVAQFMIRSANDDWPGDGAKTDAKKSLGIG